MGRRISLSLDGLAFGGEAVGREPSGRVVFVAGGAPGDRVEVELLEEKRTFARGQLVRVVEAGAARREPPCVVAGRCGGCPWMHVEVGAQRAAKEAIVARALARSGAEVRPIVGGAALGYRTRARLAWRLDGELVVGFSARRSHELVAIEACPALDPRLEAAVLAAREALSAGRARGPGALAGLVAPSGQVQLALESERSGEREPLVEVARALVGRAGIVGVLVDGAAAAGEPLLEVAPGQVASAGGFAQANDEINQALRAAAVTALFDGAPDRPAVLELYAGDGNFSRAIAGRAGRLLAVEGDPGAAARLVRNLEATAAAHTEARRAGAGEACARLVSERARFDRILLDPPRAGAAETLPALAQLGAARLVYVSCDPMTLARDVERLATLGYRASWAQPFDMMPQTSHIEVLCVLDATAPSRG